MKTTRQLPDFDRMNTHAIAADKEKLEMPVKEPLGPVTVRVLAPAAQNTDLFENSLLETTFGQRKRRTWATMFSFFLQCLLLGLAVVVPLWFTEELPKQQLMTLLVAPPPPPPPPPPAAAAVAVKAVKVVKVASNISYGKLRTPSRIPVKVQMITDDDTPPPVATSEGVVGGVPGGIPGGIPGAPLGGVIGGIIGSTSSLASAPKLSKPAPTVQRVRVSQGVIKGLLTTRVEPTYPPLAQAARIQGVVVLTAFIGKDGSIQSLQLVSGHPLLAAAAIEAVKHWRYKPFLLNGQPLEVETTVTVTFRWRASE